MDVLELARHVDRGKRSALGIHGFARGGFLVEGGKGPNSGIAPLLTRADFPAEWRVVLVLPRGEAGCHGNAEEQAFLSLRSGATDVLCRFVLLGMLPALLEVDLPAFGEALYESGSFAEAESVLAEAYERADNDDDRLLIVLAREKNLFWGLGRERDVASSCG